MCVCVREKYVRVCANLEVMLKFECFSTLVAFKSSKSIGFVVRNHVSLQAMNVCKLFMAYIA